MYIISLFFSADIRNVAQSTEIASYKDTVIIMSTTFHNKCINVSWRF